MSIQSVTESVAPRKFFTVNFWLVILWIGAALAGFAAFVALRFPMNYAGLTLGLYGFLACATELRGVSVNETLVAAPRPLLPVVPLLVLGRRKVPLDDVRDITSLGTFAGMEAIRLATSEGDLPVLFPNRAKRIAFFDAVKAAKPDLRIYRAV